jgi:hypothetical protein
MGRRAVPPFGELWQNHETLYVDIFIMALARLADQGCPAAHEDYISEQLCPILTRVCFEESRRNAGSEIRTPDWEKPLQPVNKKELKGGKKRKRPDFTCKLVNTLAEGPDDYEIGLHVECKRLGAPTGKKWNLNKNYVTEGIQRFDSRSHEYGKRAPSGMMLGYISSMTHDEILGEVHTHQQKRCPENPPIQLECERENIRKYGQDLRRLNVIPREFRLIHLWVDLPTQYDRTPSPRV